MLAQQARGYAWGSRTSISRKNKNLRLALETAPMRGIDTFFAKKTTAQQQAAAVDAAGTLNLVVGERQEQQQYEGENQNSIAYGSCVSGSLCYSC